MFKEGDIVYCINNQYNIGKSKTFTLKYINKNIPYTVRSSYADIIRLVGIYERAFTESRFISENDYKISLRIDKILKIRARS